MPRNTNTTQQNTIIYLIMLQNESEADTGQALVLVLQAPLKALMNVRTRT